jgi:hypothetical protein
LDRRHAFWQWLMLRNPFNNEKAWRLLFGAKDDLRMRTQTCYQGWRDLQGRVPGGTSWPSPQPQVGSCPVQNSSLLSNRVFLGHFQKQPHEDSQSRQ